MSALPFSPRRYDSPASPAVRTTLPPPFSTTSIPRLQALYSDFSRQKHANPTSYNSNVEWWRRALESLVGSGMQNEFEGLFYQTPMKTKRDSEHATVTASSSTSSKSDRLVLHAGRDLVERVKIPKVGKPLALGAVLSELRTSATVVPLQYFLNSKTSIHDPGSLPYRVASYVIGKPLWWALGQLGIVSEDGGSRQDQHKDTSWYGDYVMISLLKNAANQVLQKHEERMSSAGDALYTFDSFRKDFACVLDGDQEGDNFVLRETDAKVLIKYLERECRMLVVDQDVIKFVDKFATAEERIVTAVDRGILELKSAIRNLQIQIDSLHSKIDECTRKASSAIQQKRKPAALTYLRSKKLLEDLLQKRLGSLTTLESTFISVEVAASDIELMKTYESSTATLRAILAHPSLERSTVDKTMDALAEANADAREIDDAIRISGNIALNVEDAVDDTELQDELEALIKEAEEPDQLGARLGQVPNHVPSELVKEVGREAVPAFS